MLYLNVTDVIEPVTQAIELQKLARVLWLDTISDQIVLFDITKSPKKPWVMRLSDIKYLLNNGDVKIANIIPRPFMLRLEEDLSV